MDRVPSDKAKDLKVEVWPTYQQIVNDAEGREVSTSHFR